MGHGTYPLSTASASRADIITMPDLPGIGFEGKADLIRVMRSLAE